MNSFEGFIGGQEGANVIHVMNNTCLVCDKPCKTNFIALGAPYLGCCHYKCAPFFNFNGDYPHQLPVSEYKKLRRSSDGSTNHVMRRHSFYQY